MVAKDHVRILPVHLIRAGESPDAGSTQMARDTGPHLDTPSCINDDTTMASPHRHFPPRPHAGPDTAAAVDRALDELAPGRATGWLSYAGETLHMLVSLQHEITARLPDAVADARDSYHSWAEIADLLGTTRAAAWNRYARPDRRGTPRPATD
jgi:hypothetical protein